MPSASAAAQPSASAVKAEPTEEQKIVVQTADATGDASSAVDKKRKTDAKHRRFRRSLEPAPKQRAGQAKRCPPALALKIKSSNSAQIMEYVQIFTEAGEDWAESEIEIEARESTKREKPLDG